MTVWMSLLPLEKNLPVPKFATSNSAGFDLSACLTRPCVIKSGYQQSQFITDSDGRRHYYADESIKKEITSPKLLIAPNETIMISLGYKCSFNDGYYMMLTMRSSLGAAGLMLANGVGVIDADYRGELYACVYNRNIDTITIAHNQRIVQGLMIPCNQAKISLVTSLDETDRGEGGFGSTGQ